MCAYCGANVTKIADIASVADFAGSWQSPINYLAEWFRKLGGTERRRAAWARTRASPEGWRGEIEYELLTFREALILQTAPNVWKNLKMSSKCNVHFRMSHLLVKRRTHI